MLAPMTTLLVGHRGTGKTTIATQLGRLYPQLEILDLDAQIERNQDASCAELIARDGLARFRDLERDTLTQLLSQPPQAPRVIVLGAGCEHIPSGPLCVWIWRRDWTHAALKERARLWPELSDEQELERMRQTREPRWAQAAHLKLDLEPGAPDQYNARRLARQLEWAHQAREHVNASRTWIVPADQGQVERASADALNLGLAGVELRSDLFASAPHTPARWLASLRHDDPSWLTQYAHTAAAIDLDLSTLERVFAQDTLQALKPRRLLLSSHAPTHSLDAWRLLLAAATTLATRCPQWAPHLELKYAPAISSLHELSALLHEVHHAQSPYPLTLLPQGQDWAWTRPILLAYGNTSNYIPARLSDWRLPGQPSGQPAPPSPYDYQSWLPLMTGPQPRRFDALIGQPVRYSIGDELHREAALNDPEQADRGYLKIPLPSTLSADELDQALELFERLGLRGLSVTSPHKRLLPQAARINNPQDLEAANTLTLTARGWLLHDTDHLGMRASLDALEAMGIKPGSVAIFGQGGVSHALLDAIAHSDWRLIHHASAREGWSERAPEHVDLIINASGDSDAAYLNSPSSLAWIDLHYNQVRPAPQTPAARIHLNGMIFFKAQAKAQRDLWARHGLDL